MIDCPFDVVSNPFLDTAASAGAVVVDKRHHIQEERPSLLFLILLSH
jgi:hypothetical protein